MYCARCGTQNPAKATTCSQCGADLRPAPGPGTPDGRRCPMCSTVNAADATYCVQCGARVQLMADADIPTPRSSYDDDYASSTNWFDTPPEATPPASGGGWLAGLRGEAEEPAPPPAPTPPTSGGGWLSSLRGEAEPPPAAPAPPTSSGQMPPAPPPPSGGGGSWLDSLRTSSLDQTPEPANEAEPEEVALPAWLQGSQPAAPPPAPEPGEPALPAWLSESLRPSPGGSESAPPAARLPAWLADEPPAPSPTPAAPTPELPTWLAGLRAAADEEEAAEPAPAAPAPAPDSSVPAWLQDLHTTEATPPAPPTPAGGLPAWLQEQAPEPAAASAPASPPAEVPPWLQDVAMPTDLETASPPASATTSGSVPPWLAGLTDEAAAPPAIPAAAQPETAAWEAGLPGPSDAPPALNLSDEIELPAWLRAAGEAPPPAPVPTVPSWATGTSEAATAPPAPEPTEPSTPDVAAAAPADEEMVLPSWMEEPAAEVPAQPPAAEEPVAASAAEVTPPTEPSTGAAAPPTPPAEPAVPPSPRTGGTGILFPAWLNELSTTPEAEAAPAAASESGLVGEEDLPAWLRALQPEAPAAPPPAPVPPIAPTPAPVATAAEQLPEWLQALSVGTPVEEEVPEEAPVTMAEALRAVTPGRVVRARPPRPGAVETFTRLLNPPAPVVTPRPVTTRQQQIMAWLFPDRLVYVVLLLAVVAMWVLTRNGAIAPNPALAAPDATARAFHAAIAPTGVITRSSGTGGLAAPLPQQPVTGTAGLTATTVLSPALVVFDWDASRYGEMHELSRAVTRDLLTSGRPFASISLLPQGPGFADQVVNEVGDDPEFHTDLLSLPAYGGQYGTRYVNLGWRPGNEAAIHALVSEANGVVNARGAGLNYDYRYQNDLMSTYSLIQKAPTLSQYGVVILLVSDENNLRLWMEQLAGQTAVPVVAAVPASLRAGVAPYLDAALEKLTSARLRGAVFGVQGASQLEQLRLGSRPVSSAEQIRQGRWLHTESVALLVVAALLLLGFFAGIYRWSTRPRQ